jgi:hypothetical protein
MARYKVVAARLYDAGDYVPGTVSHEGHCGLHKCGEPAVATLIGADNTGTQVKFAVCERGVVEYGLRDLIAS